MFDGIQPFPSREGFSEKDVTETARQQISQAMQQAEEENHTLVAEVNRLLMSGDYKATLNFIDQNKAPLDEEKISENKTLAYIGQGNNFLNLAKTQSGEQKKKFFKPGHRQVSAGAQNQQG